MLCLTCGMPLSEHLEPHRMPGLLARCAGCGRLLRATRRRWTTRPTDEAWFHIECARAFEIIEGKPW